VFIGRQLRVTLPFIFCWLLS